MKHIGLFEGIGGFSLAASWMGWETIAWCEISPFCQTILKYYWPNAIGHKDITKTDFTVYRGGVDILTGGFPCQPYSISGKRLGKDDPRHLWPQMLRAIREIQPRWIVGENVHGIINWSKGLVFDEVQADLEREGYSVQPYVLPAAGVNAPHERKRVWFIAYSNAEQRECEERRFQPEPANGRGEKAAKNPMRDGRLFRELIEERTDLRQLRNVSPGGAVGVHLPEGFASNSESEGGIGLPIGEKQEHPINGVACSDGITSNPNGIRLRGEGDGSRKSGLVSQADEGDYWENFPTQSPIRLGNDGISRKLERYITKELEHEINKTSEENRIKNLSEMWDRISQEEIWQQVRGLYSLESKEVLFKTMQLYSGTWQQQGQLSSFSEEFCRPILRVLSKFREFRRSPFGRKLEKQQPIELKNALSFLPYEVALAAKTFEKRLARFDEWWRQESIKAGGNAIVPHVFYQICKAIKEYEQNSGYIVEYTNKDGNTQTGIIGT